jgi:hypothetical protein
MKEFLSAYLPEVVSLIVGLVGGGTIGSLVTLKIVGGQNTSRGGRNINQSKATAGGDIIGGDKSSGHSKPR